MFINYSTVTVIFIILCLCFVFILASMQVFRMYFIWTVCGNTTLLHQQHFSTGEPDLSGMHHTNACIHVPHCIWCTSMSLQLPASFIIPWICRHPDWSTTTTLTITVITSQWPTPLPLWLAKLNQTSRLLISY